MILIGKNGFIEVQDLDRGEGRSSARKKEYTTALSLQNMASYSISSGDPGDDSVHHYSQLCCSRSDGGWIYIHVLFKYNGFRTLHKGTQWLHSVSAFVFLHLTCSLPQTSAVGNTIHYSTSMLTAEVFQPSCHEPGLTLACYNVNSYRYYGSKLWPRCMFNTSVLCVLSPKLPVALSPAERRPRKI